MAINKSADQQYFIDLQNSFVQTATGFGDDAKKFDAKLDPNLGVSLVNDAISAGAKGIAITVPDQTIGPAIAKAAKDAGVVLIATDDGIKDEAGNPVPFVGFDGKDMGKKVGEAAAKLLTDSGWLKDSAKKVGVLSVEVQTLSVCVDRTDNEKAALKAAGIAYVELLRSTRETRVTAGALAAEKYGVPVLEFDIQDNVANATRFLVLGRQCGPPTGNDRTSLMFSTVDRAGALYHALAPFRRCRCCCRTAASERSPWHVPRAAPMSSP